MNRAAGQKHLPERRHGRAIPLPGRTQGEELRNHCCPCSLKGKAIMALCRYRYAGRIFLLRHRRQHALPQRQPVFHTGERQHVSTAGSLAPSCGKAARRLRSANLFFRDLLMTLERLCRYSLPLAFCAENAAPAPPAVRNIFNATLLQNDEGRSIASRSLLSRRVLPIVQTSFQTAEWPWIIASFACTISARAIRPPM